VNRRLSAKILGVSGDDSAVAALDILGAAPRRGGGEANMALVREDELGERLRAELMQAEEEFCKAMTTESKQVTLERFEHALDRYTDLLMSRSKSKLAVG